MIDPNGFQNSLRAVRAGDRDALNELTARYYPAVRAAVHKALASNLRRRKPWLTALFSTGDVVQEVFHAVVRDLGDFTSESEAAFVRFLITMVQNRLTDAVRFHEALRRDARRNAHGADGTGLVTPVSRTPDAIVESEDQIRNYLRALGTLSERDAAVLRARLQAESSYRDIASELGYPSEDAARKAFAAAQVRLLLAMRERKAT